MNLLLYTGRGVWNDMMEYSEHIPQYVRIRTYLLDLIRDRQPGDRMPSEAELAAGFSVSRGTAKQAIMDLVNSGVLYRVQGKGTFVSEPRISRSFERLPSFTEDIRQIGQRPSTRILSFKPATPPEFIRKLFGLAPGEATPRIKRVVSTNDSPIVVLSSYLNPHIYPELHAFDFKDSLYRMLQEKYGFVPIKAQDTYSILDISPETAALLKCSKSSSVVFSQRVAFLEDNRPAEYVESFIRSDRFKLKISIGDLSATPLGDCDEQCMLTHEDVSFSNIVF